jgi:hypothetical protein
MVDANKSGNGKQDLAQVAVFDQIATDWENTAGLFVTYYQTLCSGGMSKKKAMEMTQELHSMYWSVRFGIAPPFFQMEDDGY